MTISTARFSNVFKSAPGIFPPEVDEGPHTPFLNHVFHDQGTVLAGDTRRECTSPGKKTFPPCASCRVFERTGDE